MDTCPNCLLAIGLKTQIFAEKRQDMILKPVRDRAGVGARIDLKAVRDSVLIQNVV